MARSPGSKPSTKSGTGSGRVSGETSKTNTSRAAKTSAKARTIDLDPSQVTKRKTAQTTASGKSKASPAQTVQKPGATQAPETDKAAAAKANAKASAQTAGGKSTSNAPATQKPSDPKTSTGTNTGTNARKPEPPKSRRAANTSIGVLSLAGAIGGLIVLLGGLALLGSGVWSSDTDEQSNQIAALEQRIADLQSALSSTSSTDDIAVLTNTITDLENRLGVADDRLAALQSSVNDQLQSGSDAIRSQIATLAETQDAAARETEAALAARITDIAEEQAALQQALANGAGGEAPALATLTTTLDALQSRLNAFETELANLAAQADSRVDQNALTELTQNMAARDDALKSDLSADLANGLTSMRSELSQTADTLSATLSTGLEAARAEIESDIVQSGNADLDIVLDHMQRSLTLAARSGEPFTGLYTRVTELDMAHDLDLPLNEALASAAANGLSSLADLEEPITRARLARLDAQSEAAPEAEMVTPQGLLDGLMQGASSLVTIKRLDESEGEAAIDAVDQSARAAAIAARHQDASALLAALGSLPDTFSPDLTAWRVEAQNWQALNQLTSALQHTQQSRWAETGDAQ